MFWIIFHSNPNNIQTNDSKAGVVQIFPTPRQWPAVTAVMIKQGFMKVRRAFLSKFCELHSRSHWIRKSYELVHTIWERKMRTFQTTTLIENIPEIWKRKLEKTFDFFTAWLMSALSAGGKNFHEYSAFACRGQFHHTTKLQSPKID